MASITPTIGRRVWYFASANEKRWSMLPFHKYGDGPLDAGIAHVNEDGTVNLSVSDSAGNQHARQNVLFIDNDQTPMPSDGCAYATWMPFQLGQARATQPAQAIEQQNVPPLPQVSSPPLAPEAAPAPAIAQIDPVPLAPVVDPAPNALPPAAPESTAGTEQPTQ